METTKIQSVTPQGTWQGNNGATFHKSDIILENGMVGEVNAKTPDKWKVGDEVVVKEHQQTKWGPRLKLDKPGFGGQSFDKPTASGVDRQESIVTQWAIREAQTYVFNGTKAPDQVTLYDIWGVAKHLKSMHDNFDTWGGIYKKETSQREQELAPENCPPVPDKEPVPGDDNLPF